MTQKTITFTVDIPEGYGVKFNKNSNQIEFIKKDSKPKSWEEYCEQVKNTRCYTYMYNLIVPYDRTSDSQYDEFDTEEEAAAFIALGKLIQLHKVWVKGWKPDWKDNNNKYTIEGFADGIHASSSLHVRTLLSFPTEELCKEFLDTFKDLLEEAKPFL